MWEPGGLCFDAIQQTQSRFPMRLTRFKRIHKWFVELDFVTGDFREITCYFLTPQTSATWN